jgi:hypothetical protein
LQKMSWKVYVMPHLHVSDADSTLTRLAIHNMLSETWDDHTTNNQRRRYLPTIRRALLQASEVEANLLQSRARQRRQETQPSHESKGKGRAIEPTTEDEIVDTTPETPPVSELQSLVLRVDDVLAKMSKIDAELKSVSTAKTKANSTPQTRTLHTLLISEALKHSVEYAQIDVNDSLDTPDDTQLGI